MYMYSCMWAADRCSKPTLPVVREIRDKKSRNCSNCDTSMKLSVNVALNM